MPYKSSDNYKTEKDPDGYRYRDGYHDAHMENKNHKGNDCNDQQKGNESD
jgi:hypothetical protein